MRTPGISIPFVSQGVKEAMLSDDAEGLPITIDATRLGSSSANVYVPGPSLFARISDSPYTARPFMQTADITTPTNTTNATVDIPNADAVKFKVGDKITFYDVSAGALSAESLTLDIIGAAGSGQTGALTLLTFTADVWSTPPVAHDLLVVKDGTELSERVLVVLEDINFDGSTTYESTGYFDIDLNKAKVGNTTYFDNTKAPNIQLLDTQGY